MNTDKPTTTASAPETRTQPDTKDIDAALERQKQYTRKLYAEVQRTIPAEKRPTDEDNVGSTWNWLPAKVEQAQTANVVEQTKVILRKHAPWIEKHMALVATPMQEPRDLIADALRRAGFDIYASGSKATEIMRKEREI